MPSRKSNKQHTQSRRATQNCSCPRATPTSMKNSGATRVEIQEQLTQFFFKKKLGSNSCENRGAIRMNTREQLTH